MEIAIISLGTLLVLATNKLYVLSKMGIMTAKTPEEAKANTVVKRYSSLAGLVGIAAGVSAAIVWAPMAALVAAGTVAAISIAGTVVANTITNILMPSKKSRVDNCIAGVGSIVIAASLLTGAFIPQALAIGGAMLAYRVATLIWNMFSSKAPLDIEEITPVKTKSEEGTIEEAEIVPSKMDMTIQEVIADDFKSFTAAELKEWVVKHKLPITKGLSKHTKQKLISLIKNYYAEMQKADPSDAATA